MSTNTKRMGRPISLPDTDNPLARLRRLRGWSQIQAASEIGFTGKGSVSRIERGLQPLIGPARKKVFELLGEKEPG